jgi:phosphoribosylamine--glycine ligase
VVIASERYPAEPRTGDVIEGLDDAARVEGAIVFHSGTRRDGDLIRTAGGRVLTVSAMGATIEAARERAYDAVDRISWPGHQYRRDIAAAAAGA